ncbi:CG5757 [Drosophila busckii]|uniref:Thymidylate kinase n=1 Tax=Drosophila busckii TaxID=30019 RepID=A0A0M4EVZ6_DROBS|nr:thymidylate kinase [Drosophila busckii]ALC42150.1 CG5757 [Drosophila busckii]
MSEQKRGLFIVFEGCDRVGKTTQSRLLCEGLQQKGVDVKRINFPDRTTSIGQVINSYLTSQVEHSHQVIHLLFSANRWERIEDIKQELLNGKTLICDRYAYSGAAYSVAKGLDLKWCCAPDLGLLQPDAVIYMKAKPEALTARGNYGDERFDNVEFQRKVSDVFDGFMAEQRDKDSCYWHEIDASQSKEALQQQIAKIVESLQLKISTKPLVELC